MKLNFRRIASVFAGAVMLSSTVAFAAAAGATTERMFPDPYVKAGVADAVVVYGSALAIAATDISSAMQVATEINKLRLAQVVTPTPSTPTVTGEGDQVPLEGLSSKLHLGAGVRDVFSRSVTSDDLKTLLAESTYTDSDNGDHDYTQKIDVANITLTQFKDSDYKTAPETPILGFKINSGATVLNYTLDFTDNPAFDKLANTDLSMMGKKYYILSATNTSALTPYVTLLDAATTVTVAEGATKEVTVGGKTYSITVTDVTSTTSADKVKFTVNGKSPSSSIAKGGTFKVETGVYVGVKDVSYKSKESATSSAELSIGTGKLVVKNATDVEMNEKTITGLTAFVSTSDSNTKLDKIALQWKANDDSFVTSNSSITMPGFEAVKLSTLGMKYSDSEEIEVENDGKTSIQLKAPIKNGDVTLNILNLNKTSGNYSWIGKEASRHLLRTSNTSTLTFNASDNTDDAFVVSWKSGKDSESYVLYASSFGQSGSSNEVNETTLYGKESGNPTFGEGKKINTNTGTFSFGNVQLTVSDINYAGKFVTLTAGSNVVFNKLYTKKGLEITLPTTSVTQGYTESGGGAFNASAGISTYNLIFTEESKDGDVGLGATDTRNFNITLGSTGDAGDKQAYVSGATGYGYGAGAEASEEIGSSDVYQEAVYSALATIVLRDTGPVQDTATIKYHGGESYATLLLTAPTVSVGGGGVTPDVGQVLSVTDAETAKMTGKNMIVVGGSCINTVAAKLLGSTTPVCTADFTTKTGVKAGEYLVKTFANPDAPTKIATLVAGFEAKETQQAVDFLLKQNVSTDVGATYVTGVKKVATTGTA